MIIECRHIAYRYPASDTDVFTDLSFTIAGPGFYGLFGPSGVGKTSLARILAGLSPSRAGSFQFTGIDTVLYTYNLERLPGWSSIGRHLDRILTSAQHGMRDTLVAGFQMAGVMDSRFTQLSLGQKNRINLIRYLLQTFDVLIMDESLANVDEMTRGRIISQIKSSFPQKIFIYISHNIIEVSRYCRQVIVMRGKGKQPAVTAVNGMDGVDGDEPDQAGLDQTMLEIMNAA